MAAGSCATLVHDAVSTPGDVIKQARPRSPSYTLFLSLSLARRTATPRAHPCTGTHAETASKGESAREGACQRYGSHFSDSPYPYPYPAPARPPAPAPSLSCVYSQRMQLYGAQPGSYGSNIWRCGPRSLSLTSPLSLSPSLPHFSLPLFPTLSFSPPLSFLCLLRSSPLFFGHFHNPRSLSSRPSLPVHGLPVLGRGARLPPQGAVGALRGCVERRGAVA